ncbi:MAG: 2-polyprenyl-3-methyl-6-methoxy-1,4-benzoquinone monooxygenase [Gammaproteobacteria bacterium]|nr:2-polyprenyl-3-methyl-6-methoxy-1,4-benzoquinone monooxygenase [Gammaproteobacteria bacterium]MDH5776801.1 2-polyprenyl-3-methyl-6-methoxy-1,4-benzoquinone monooxygenase [Gammaproteobacteria bacterium]
MNSRHYSPIDKLIQQFDAGLRTVAGNPPVTERSNPAAAIQETELNQADKELAGRLMRINHAGEVSAQGLYQGQALTARLPEVRDKMERAALEENDHLAWCERRCKELGTHTSLLSPFWYMGSLTIGAIAGIAGDKWSLGFVAETEHQVVRHLDSHMTQINPNDKKSHAILEQMKEDEAHHATVALHAGGAELPRPVKTLMGLTSKVMTRTAFWL